MSWFSILCGTVLLVVVLGLAWVFYCLRIAKPDPETFQGKKVVAKFEKDGGTLSASEMRTLNSLFIKTLDYAEALLNAAYGPYSEYSRIECEGLMLEVLAIQNSLSDKKLRNLFEEYLTQMDAEFPQYQLKMQLLA